LDKSNAVLVAPSAIHPAMAFLASFIGSIGFLYIS